MNGRCGWFHAPSWNCGGSGRQVSKGCFILAVGLARNDGLVRNGFISMARQGGCYAHWISVNPDAEPRQGKMNARRESPRQWVEFVRGSRREGGFSSTGCHGIETGFEAISLQTNDPPTFGHL